MAPVTDYVEPVVEPIVTTVEPVVEPVTTAVEPVVEPVTSAVEPASDIAQPALVPEDNQADEHNIAGSDQSLTGLSGAVNVTLEGEISLSIATPSAGDAEFRSFIDHASSTVDPSVLDVVIQQLPASVVLDPLLGVDGQTGVMNDALINVRLHQTAGVALEPTIALFSDIELVNPVADVSNQLVESLAIVPGPALTTVQDTNTSVIGTTTTLTPVIDVILHVEMADPVGDVTDQLVGSAAFVTDPALATVQRTTTSVTEAIRPALEILDVSGYIPGPAVIGDVPLPVNDTLGPITRLPAPIAPLNPKAGPDEGASVDDVVVKAPARARVTAEPARQGSDSASGTNDSVGTNVAATSSAGGSARLGTEQLVLAPVAPISVIPNLVPAAHDGIAPASGHDVRASNRITSSSIIAAAIARNQAGLAAADMLPASAPASQRSEPLRLAGTGIPSGASAGQGDSTSAHGESPHGSLGDVAALGSALRQKWLSSSARIPSSIASYVPVRPG